MDESDRNFIKRLTEKVKELPPTAKELDRMTRIIGKYAFRSEAISQELDALIDEFVEEYRMSMMLYMPNIKRHQC